MEETIPPKIILDGSNLHEWKRSLHMANAPRYGSIANVIVDENITPPDLTGLEEVAAPPAGTRANAAGAAPALTESQKALNAILIKKVTEWEINSPKLFGTIIAAMNSDFQAQVLNDMNYPAARNASNCIALMQLVTQACNTGNGNNTAKYASLAKRLENADKTACITMK